MSQFIQWPIGLLLIVKSVKNGRRVFILSDHGATIHETGIDYVAVERDNREQE